MQETNTKPSTSWMGSLSRTAAKTAGYLNPFKKMLTASFVINLIPQTVASICFETPNSGSPFGGADNTLDCGNFGGQEAALYKLLVQSCGAYTDGQNDCANFFVDSWNFGSGYFGGAICTLWEHTGNTPSACVMQVLRDNVKNGYGTAADIGATIGIVLGGLVGITIVGGGALAAYRFFNTQRNAAVNEQSRLINEDGRDTAPTPALTSVVTEL